MSKVGILTFHRTTNFGSLLQTFALYRKILNLGHDAYIIDYRSSAIESREFYSLKPFSPKRFLKYLWLAPKRRSFNSFLKKNFKLTKSFSKSEGVSQTKHLEILISGSDILWGKDITDGDITYFLDFAESGQKKVSYATSIGDVSLWNGDKRIDRLIKSFDALTVRESSSVKWVEEKTGKKVSLVCDPTMLFDKNEWAEMLDIKEREGDYVVVYFDNANHKCINDAIRYAENKKLKVYYLCSSKKIDGVKNIQPKDVCDFLTLIRNASFIFTSSYHGMLFSLYFEKRFAFYTLLHKERVISLSKKLGVEERCFDIKDNGFDDIIDYSKVNKAISSFRNESTKILEKILND